MRHGSRTALAFSTILIGFALASAQATAQTTAPQQAPAKSAPTTSTPAAAPKAAAAPAAATAPAATKAPSAAPAATAPQPAAKSALNNRSVEIINKSTVALRNLYAEQGNKEGTWKNYLPSSSRIEPGDSKVVDFGDIGTTGEGSCKRDLYFDFVGGGVSAQGKEN